MQRILYRTPTPEALEELFGSDDSTDAACELPMGESTESVLAGAWVLAVFETLAASDSPPQSVGPVSRPPASSRATCAPARVVERADGSLGLQFSGPDWRRIASYARVRRESSVPQRNSERLPTSRPVHVPSVFPAAPLPQVETMCILHLFEDQAAGALVGEALGRCCRAFTVQDELVAFAAEQKAAGQRLDAIVFQQPADEELVATVRRLRDEHADVVLLCLTSGARAQSMRALYEAGADELLQAQTSPAEVAVTLLALARRRTSKSPDALGAA